MRTRQTQIETGCNTCDREMLINVEGAGKKFCRDLRKSLWYGLKDVASELVAGKRHSEKRALLRPEEFWAVDAVSFQVRRGDCLGLIGRNGAGKTTLLKMLNGLIKPDKGRIEMRGRVGALIALGMGFNPILTGRENIYVNASVLGLSAQEIDAKFQDIVDFAEIGESIDSAVQSYSSGMQVRLGFAIATVLEPDILILDEVLAVGDAAFRMKCYRRIAELRRKAAVIFVTHNMEQVSRICDQVLVLDRGRVCGYGSSEEGVALYEKLNQCQEDSEDCFLSCQPLLSGFQCLLGKTAIETGRALEFEIRLEAQTPVSDFILRFTFYNASGAFAADCNLQSEQHSIKIHSGPNVWRFQIPSLPLKRGRYKISINIIDPFGEMLVWSYKQHSLEVVGGYPGAVSDCQLQIRHWEELDPDAAASCGVVGPNQEEAGIDIAGKRIAEKRGLQ